MSYQRRLIGRQGDLDKAPSFSPSDAVELNNVTQMGAPDFGEVERRLIARHEDDESIDKDEDNLLEKVPRVGVGYKDEPVPPTTQEFDAQGRLIIHPIGNTFHENTEVLGFVKKTIQSYFDGPWPSFSKVPKDTKHFWWTEFQNNFCWEDRYAPIVEVNWRTKCSSHIRNAFCQAHKLGKNPPFVKTDDWNEIKRLKDTESSKHLSETNKRNRSSTGPDGTAIYTGGSRSVVHNMLKFDHFKQLCAEWLESHQCEIIPQEVVNDLWSQANGNKGKLCGQGALMHHMCGNVNPPLRSPSPTTGHQYFLESDRAVSPSLNRATSPPRPEFSSHVMSALRNGNDLQRQVDQQSQDVMGIRMEEQEAIIKELQYQLLQEKRQRLMEKSISQGSHVNPSNTSFQVLLNSQSYLMHDKDEPTNLLAAMKSSFRSQNVHDLQTRTTSSLNRDSVNNPTVGARGTFQDRNV